MTYCILGAGKTSLACQTFLTKKGLAFEVVTDIDKHKPDPNLTYIPSPGIPFHHPLISAICTENIPLLSDVDLFLKYNHKPLICVTGTNGKTTVVHLITAALEKLGLSVGMGGNLTASALDLLSLNADVYVLELSSFQLYYTQNLHCHVGVLTNLTLDHQDWHQTFEHYLTAKLKLLKHSEVTVMGSDLGQYFQVDYTINTKLPIIRQNVLFAEAALKGLGYKLTKSFKAALEEIRLPHRQETFVARGITWINDSKATNVSATMAMLADLDIRGGSVFWILGGKLKGQADFKPLKPCLEKSTFCVVGYGEARQTLKKIFDFTYEHESLEAVMSWLSVKAKPGDTVVLSPACASLDQFKNFEARGDFFKAYVQRL